MFHCNNQTFKLQHFCLVSFHNFNFVFIFSVLLLLLTQSYLTLRCHGVQHPRPPGPSPTPGVYSNSCPLIGWCNPIISFSVIPFSSCLQSFPALGSLPVSQFFASGGQSIGLQLQHQSFQWIFRIDFLYDWLVWSSSSPGDSQESSPTPQFKSISSSALSFLYGTTLKSIHD